MGILLTSGWTEALRRKLLDTLLATMASCACSRHSSGHDAHLRCLQLVLPLMEELREASQPRPLTDNAECRLALLSRTYQSRPRQRPPRPSRGVGAPSCAWRPRPASFIALLSSPVPSNRPPIGPLPLSASTTTIPRRRSPR